MNVSDRIRVADLMVNVQDMKNIKDVRKVMLLLFGRIDTAYQDLILQLRKEPTIFTVNPVSSSSNIAAAVQGAKTGDIAVYLNDQGDVEIERFT